MEINPRDQVKLISTARADFSEIRRIEHNPYAISGTQHISLFSEIVPFPKRLQNFSCDNWKEAQDVKILDAYDHTLPKKEKDIGSFTLPYFIHNNRFDKALVDLGACIGARLLQDEPIFMGQVIPLAFMAQATKTVHNNLLTTLLTLSVHISLSTNDAMLAMMNQIVKLLTGQITTENVQRRDLANKGKQVATGSQGKLVTCYNCRGQGHIARECKEKKREKDSQWFKDKALLMEAKEKGAILDAEAEAFLADVECTTPYVEPLAITTTTAFKVSHEDAYDSDVDEAPHAAAAFMDNLTDTST
ncbi:retrovirus-related pol polyprotein from transposon TNT 1-94 [Tanacetum coccineum]